VLVFVDFILYDLVLTLAVAALQMLVRYFAGPYFFWPLMMASC
jgi:hypothetical protein